MLRSALILALMVPMSAATPQTTAPMEAVPLVVCPQGDGSGYSGSAFRIGPHLLLSVKHVTNLPHCMIDGLPIHVLYTSPTADFSVLIDDRAGKWLKVNCGGFIAGREYIAIGHPRGLDGLVAVKMTATGESDEGLSKLTGVFTVQPGHSGGEIIDKETGEVVGTINAADWESGLSFSVPLSETPICKRNIV